MALRLMIVIQRQNKIKITIPNNDVKPRIKQADDRQVSNKNIAIELLQDTNKMHE